MTEQAEGNVTSSEDNMLQEDESSMPVSVSVVVNDPECGAYMSHVGIFLMYYCEHCGLASRSLPDITGHLAQQNKDSASCSSASGVTVDVRAHIDSIIELLNLQLKGDGGKSMSYSNSTVPVNTDDLDTTTESIPTYLATEKDDINIGNQNVENSYTHISGSEVIKKADENGEYVKIIEEEGESELVENNNVVEDNENIVENGDPEKIVEKDDPDYIPTVKSTPRKTHNFRGIKKKHKRSTSPQPNGLNTEEKELFLNAYIEFVKQNVKLVLFNEPVESVNFQNNDMILDDILLYDKLKLLDATPESVWSLPMKSDRKLDLSCEFCPRIVFNSKAELDIHKKCHSGDYPGYRFHCCSCKRNSTTLNTESKEWPEMKQHLINVHNYEFRTKCSDCDMEFLSCVELRVHKTAAHRLYCQYKFHGCKFCTQSVSDLKLHHDCHIYCEEGGSVHQFQCQHCSFGNKSKYTWTLIRDHYARKHTHILDQSNLCPGCLCNFLDKDTYLDHYVLCDKVNLVRHQCLICTKGSKPNYVPLPSLEDHLVQHVYSERKYVQEKLRKVVDLLKANTSMMNIYTVFCGSKNWRVDLADEKENASFVLKASSTPGATVTEAVDLPENVVVTFTEANVAVLPQGDTVDEVNNTGPEVEGEYTEIDGIRVKVEILSKPVTEVHTVQVVHDPIVADYEVEAYSDGSYKCKMCYKRQRNKVNMIRHMARCHPNGTDVTTCEECGKTFRTKSLCRNHYAYIHQGKKRNYAKYDPAKQKSKVYKCDECYYTTPHSTRLRNHMMSVHLGVMPYQCEICLYTSNEQSDMKRHMNKHSGFKKFQCDKCDYKAAQYWLLKSHCLKQHYIFLPPRRPPVNLMGTTGSLRRNINNPSAVTQPRKRTSTNVLKRNNDFGIVGDCADTEVVKVIPETIPELYEEHPSAENVIATSAFSDNNIENALAEEVVSGGFIKEETRTYTYIGSDSDNVAVYAPND